MSQGRCHNAIFAMPHDSPNIQFLGEFAPGCWMCEMEGTNLFSRREATKGGGKGRVFGVLAVFVVFHKACV